METAAMTSRITAAEYRVRFFVPGVPVPQGSMTAIPRLTRRGYATGKTYLKPSVEGLRAWREAIQMWALEHRVRLLSGPVRLELYFSLPCKGRLTAAKKPDLDKLVRAVCDALTGYAYRDDAQVVDLICSKRLSEDSPGVEIAIEEVRP